MEIILIYNNKDRRIYMKLNEEKALWKGAMQAKK